MHARRLRRWCIGAAAVLLAAVAGVVPALSLGQTEDFGGGDPHLSNPNPLKSNVPYLAWRGEEIRFVKCQSDFNKDEYDRLMPPPDSASTRYKVDFVVESWSGTEWSPNQPHVENGTIDVFYERGGRYDPAEGYKGGNLCFKGDVVSLYPGLARIKMVITRVSEMRPPTTTATIESISQPPSSGGADEIVVKHQFLAIWMSLNSVDVSNVTGGATPSQFIAGGPPGLIKAEVDGVFPYAGQTWKLPDQWPDLARRVAVDQNANNLHDEYRWDIHDDTTEAEGHPLYGGGPSPLASYSRGRCNDEKPSGLSPRLDAVDNCLGGRSFSRAWDPDGPLGAMPPSALDLSEWPTIGPFDPKRWDETFLPDGNLTPDDAPMPAAQLDLKIAPNGGSGSVGGAGFFAGADKDRIFRRDDDGHGWGGHDIGVDAGPEPALAGSSEPSHSDKWYDKPHSLYAPFYSRYIPATAAPTNVASGTDGPPGNNFPGYLVNGKYQYWDLAHVFARGTGDSGCLYRAWDLWSDGKNEKSGYKSKPSSPLPEGPQHVAVYTDEHGQAYVRWFPGWAFFPPQLNNNQACDFEKRNPLGTSDITAKARYPYQPVDAEEPSDQLERLTIGGNTFRKDLIVFPKGEGEKKSRLLVAHAQDIFGKPFSGEKVCFQRVGGHGGISGYIGGSQVLDAAPGSDDPETEYDVSGHQWEHGDLVDMLCTRLNKDGNAVIEVDGSANTEVLAIFVDERIKRFCDVPLGSAPAVVHPCDDPPAAHDPGPGAGGPTPGGGPGDPGGSSGDPGAGGQAPGGGSPAAGGGGAAAGAGAIARSEGSLKVSPSRKAKSARLRFARLLTSAEGKRRLQIRLDGTAKSVKLRIRFTTRSGRTLRTVVRSVKVGRTVTLSGVSVPRGATKVRIAIVG